MDFLAYFCYGMMAAYGLILVTYLSVFLLHADRGTPQRLQTARKQTPHPPISILVAARNEEAAIEDCLKSLAALDYPVDRIQILVGDDASEDDTAKIVQRFIAGKLQFRYFRIQETLPGLRGKQNVLAQLARHATGEFLLITDADIRVNPRWAAAMVGGFSEGVGVMNGVTAVWGRNLFAKVQGLDWIMGLVLMRAHALLGIPITAMGNNMALRKSAYDALGGYEALPFSVIEDYLLFQKLCERGPWKFVQRFHKDVWAVSLPLQTLDEWAKQRRRWFAGGRIVAWYNRAMITFNATLLPVFVLSLFVLPRPWPLVFALSKLVFDFLLLLSGAATLGKTRWLGWYLPYQVYSLCSMVATPLLALIPGAIVWKGRKY